MPDDGLTRADRIHLPEQVSVESTCSYRTNLYLESRNSHIGCWIYLSEFIPDSESTWLNLKAHFIRIKGSLGSHFASRDRESLWLMDDPFNRFKQLVKEKKKRGKGTEMRNRGLRRSLWIKRLTLSGRKREREGRAWKFRGREIYSCESRSFTGDRWRSRSVLRGFLAKEGKETRILVAPLTPSYQPDASRTPTSCVCVRRINLSSLAVPHPSMPRHRAEPSYPLFLFTSRESATG